MATFVHTKLKKHDNGVAVILLDSPNSKVCAFVCVCFYFLVTRLRIK